MLSRIEFFNRFTFLLINAKPGASDSLLQCANFFANKLIYAIPVCIVFLWFRYDRKTRPLALKISLTIITGIILSVFIGTIWPQPRPFMIPIGYVWFSHAADYSFPSDHMTVFMCLSLSLISSNAIIPGIVMILISFVVAWSRIFLGVHFPLDMVGGILVAIIANYLSSITWRYSGEKMLIFFNKLSLIVTGR